MIRLSRDGAGIVVPIRVSPGAARTRPGGEHAGRWRIYVQAPPEKDRANRAACEVVARALGVRRRDVSVVAGGRHPDKQVRVEGLNAGAARAHLAKLGIQAEVNA